MNNGYLSKHKITNEIKEVVAKTHNLNKSDIMVNWLSSWRLVKFPTGLIQKAGKIRLRTSGFRTRDFFVYQTKNQKWSMY